MKLLQINIWGGRLEYALVDYIKKVDPDIICLQEAIGLEGGKSALYASVGEIQEAIGADNAFLSSTFSFQYMNRMADFGNCIITKFPFKSERTVFTGGEYIRDFDFSVDDSNMRNLQHAVIQLPEGEINILNHHGYWVASHKNGNAETMRQCKVIADYIRSIDGPMVLTGDFNLIPQSESLSQINTLLRNLSLEYKLSTTRNSLTHKNEVCDYIFVSSDIDVKSFDAPDVIVSDHRPLIAEIEIKSLSFY